MKTFKGNDVEKNCAKYYISLMWFGLNRRLKGGVEEGEWGGVWLFTGPTNAKNIVRLMKLPAIRLQSNGRSDVNPLGSSSEHRMFFFLLELRNIVSHFQTFFVAGPQGANYVSKAQRTLSAHTVLSVNTGDMGVTVNAGWLYQNRKKKLCSQRLSVAVLCTFLFFPVGLCAPHTHW